MRSGTNFGVFLPPTGNTYAWIMGEAYNQISANATFVAREGRQPPVDLTALRPLVQHRGEANLHAEALGVCGDRQQRLTISRSTLLATCA